MRIVKVSCPGCGGALAVGENTKATTCERCGSNVILDWEGQTSAAVHIELGLTSLQLDKFSEAEWYFTRALEKNVRSRDAWFWKGVVTALRSAGPERSDRSGMSGFSGVADANLYLHKSGFTDEEAVETLTRWMRGSGHWKADCRANIASVVVKEGSDLRNVQRTNWSINGRYGKIYTLVEESRWYGILDQALRNCQKRKNLIVIGEAEQYLGFGVESIADQDYGEDWFYFTKTKATLGELLERNPDFSPKESDRLRVLELKKDDCPWPRGFLLRTSAQPGSFGKTWDEQKGMLSEGESVPTARDLIQGIIAYYRKTGEQLFSGYQVRTQDYYISYDEHIGVGILTDGVHVLNYRDECHCSDLGLAVVRQVWR